MMIREEALRHLNLRTRRKVMVLKKAWRNKNAGVFSKEKLS